MSNIKLSMTDWNIPQTTPPINLGDSGENNAILISIDIDNKIDFDDVKYYFDIMDKIDGEKTISRTQEMELVEHTDIFLLDIKHINPEWHKKITGQDNAPVLRFLDYLESKWKRVRLRHVLVPWYSDQMEYIEEMGKKLHWYKCVERMEILPYHRLGEYKRKALWWKYPLEWVEPPKSEVIDKAKKILEKYYNNNI